MANLQAELDNAAGFELPLEALELLRGTAFLDTSLGRITRTFLFWLIGEQDPGGHVGAGALEFRKLDARHQLAALNVLNWWWGSDAANDKPIYNILEQLSQHFSECSGSES